MTPPRPRSTLFPYTTLFRSQVGAIPGHLLLTVSQGSGRHHINLKTPARIAAELGYQAGHAPVPPQNQHTVDRKSTRLNSSHVRISYAVFCLKKEVARSDFGG